jgi:hypothetical protein
VSNNFVGLASGYIEKYTIVGVLPGFDPWRRQTSGFHWMYAAKTLLPAACISIGQLGDGRQWTSSRFR